MMRQFFATTLGQILAIIATSSAITFLLFLLLFWLIPGVPPPPPWPWQPAYRIVSLVDSITAAPESQGLIIAAAQRPGLSVRLTQAPILCESLSTDARALESVLRSEFGKTKLNLTVRGCSTADPAQSVQVLIDLGPQMLDIRTGRVVPDTRHLTLPFAGAVLFLCVAVASMSAWAVWRVIGPLRRLSAQAEAFGRDISTSPIAEEGPLEMRRVARAFNLMQQRISRSIMDRTRMLAAISHDLRTPLTRMRLQLETQSTDAVRGKLLRDVGLMQSMVTSALTYLSGGIDQEDWEWLDLSALVAALCDEFAEAGADISFEAPEQIRFFCRPNAIGRALTNLIENGIHFGRKVLVSAAAEDKTITIEVADDGPGIPKERVQDVLVPFVRLDPARSLRPGSVGLGLSIVKEIAEAHGGRLELIDRQPRGLIARLVFPADPAGPGAL